MTDRADAALADPHDDLVGRLSRRRVLAQAGGLAAAALLAPGRALAQAPAFPSRPVTLVVAYPPGGDADAVCRLLQAAMQEALGQTVVIENKGGAGGNIGVSYGLKQPADGYTVTFVNQGIVAFNPSLYASTGFTVGAMAPVTLMTTTDLLFCVPAASPAKTLPQFLDMACKSPGRLTYGTAGNGSANHMATKLLESNANVALMHVPYKGGAPAIMDAISGQLDAVMAFPLAALPQIRAGKLRALAVTGAHRSPTLPDVPIAECGVADYNYASWNGLVVPKGTPAAVIERLHAATARALKVPATATRLREGLTEPLGSGPREFAQLMASEGERWAGIIRQFNIRAD